ncbi:L,D-transpeptidase family protein [Salipiger bermudensis]|uniref:L,D-transpeptidase family protein n=1 Tax=Salipiger bermudensis TaxID=344736 RepID=UPI001CD3E818|nr:L,D-transpeptidase family protein [Salipiger bermudensis]MCA0961047.1 L,D-transpeptidase family protein [Salipiger bermudensis]
MTKSRRQFSTALKLGLAIGVSSGWMFAAAPQPAQAQSLSLTGYKLAVAESLSEDEGMAAFYRARGFEPIWTSADDAATARRAALIEALSTAGNHGLPARRYDPTALMAMMRAVRSDRDRGQLEVELSRAYLQFAHDLSGGALDGRRIDSGIKRPPVRRPSQELLEALATGEPRAVFRELAPTTPEYTRLMREKMSLERIVARGGWGAPVTVGKLEPGDSGPGVVILRDRLIEMEYLKPTLSPRYDDTLRNAVLDFQRDHGLAADGVAGPSTLSALNVPAVERLKSVIVAMERERWINFAEGLGERHVKVNIVDFHASIIDDGKVTFETRSVVGAKDTDRRTPEFSDVMEFMVINPSWYVPRSIVVNEYLPQLRRNPGAVSHLVITDSRGRQVNRGHGFAQYSAASFPFSMRQPPGPRNALGQVKFMFPNKYNIYLHDTPSKSLFSRTERAFSHGCIRLADPKDFAYALLALQTDDPEGFFASRLRGGSESRVNLEKPVPVHLIYRTAFSQAKGKMNYRADVYGRDAKIWDALAAAGVALGGVES